MLTFNQKTSIVALGTMLAFIPVLPGCNNPIVADPLPPQGQNACCLLMIVHGLGDTPEDWPAELLSTIENRAGDAKSWDIVTYDWSAYATSEDGSTASRSGMEIGRQVGQALASPNYRYEHIHFIAHSVGSFVIHAAAQTYRQQAAMPARIHMTFIDPFTLHGFTRLFYGKKKFGAEADFAETYVNTDDPVPSTNTPLNNTHNFDLTETPGKITTGADAHWWPVDYYIMTAQDRTLPYGFQLAPMAAGSQNPVAHADFPRGASTVVP